MKTLCCKCSVEIEPIDGVGFSYCDRCAKAAGFEIELDQAETKKRRARERVDALDDRFGSCKDPVYRAEREAEFEHWEDRVSELRLRISELGA